MHALKQMKQYLGSLDKPNTWKEFKSPSRVWPLSTINNNNNVTSELCSNRTFDIAPVTEWTRPKPKLHSASRLIIIIERQCIDRQQTVFWSSYQHSTTTCHCVSLNECSPFASIWMWLSTHQSSCRIIIKSNTRICIQMNSPRWTWSGSSGTSVVAVKKWL